MKRAAFTIMVITMVSKVFGFLREMALSYVYGVSGVTDAYLISGTIPTVIFSLICAGISTSFIPMYSRISKSEGAPAANRFTNNLSNALILVSTVVVAIVLSFTEPLVKLFAVGFEGETLKMAVTFTRISVFGVYFTALAGIYGGFLRIHGNYAVPALVGFPLNLVTIAFLFISARTNPHILVIGSVLASASQLAFMLPFLMKTGFRYELVFLPKDEQLRNMVFIALPIILGGSVNRVNTLVDRTLASNLAEGGISALSYASRLESFVSALFVGSITTALYPMISNMAAEGNLKGLKDSLSEAIVIVGLLVIPATVGAMIFSKEIVQLLFGRGAFTPEAVSMTANALFYYSVGMIGLLSTVLRRAFYALQDTRTPVINSVISVSINIVLNLILSRFMGIGGLALATSIAAITSTMLMFITLRRKIGGFGLKRVSGSLIKILVASALMGASVYMLSAILDLHLQEHLAFILSVGAGALVYSFAVYLMRIQEVHRVLTVAFEKVRNRGYSVLSL